MSVVVTAADVYSDIDPDHAVGAIQRVGGGQYRFIPGDGSKPPDDVDTFDEAIALSDAFVVELEKDPAASGDALTVKRLSAELATANERIRTLEAKLGGDIAVEAIPVDGIKVG